jgi:predicted nucleic acid-binding protein
VAVTHLVDTSVWARIRQEAVATVLDPMFERGVLGTCGVIDLEFLRSARNGAEHAAGREFRRDLTWLPMPDEVWDRAIAVQGMLAERSQHRAISIPDLLIAATAERHEVPVLHYDHDYDLIAAVTGQPTQWIVPRGAVP